MNLFAIDTTGAELSLALQTEGRLFSFSRELAAPNDETLLPQAQRLLKKAGLAWKDLDAVVAASGPGRFTGIRIGMSFAAVLARRLGIPALAVSRFEALAAKTPGRLVCAVLPGWRDEMFYQLFRRARPAAAPVWASAQEWSQAKAEMASRGAVLAQTAVRAQDLLPCAERLLRRKRRPRFEPLYLKPASYELKHKAGAAG
ncbi:MAG: tRNA (adenosine(37)-N6)-threonylcarbamoyltransferase complex dimerization subunit type 1 TsaB [Elusimicrobia bacterium]|nr:tRNA (adenosine(37)-N6)-threonylcarbamoyltransferase complex dimerization subunit type 1 TsaB [Elusimicrobiota bacterium]